MKSPFPSLSGTDIAGLGQCHHLEVQIQSLFRVYTCSVKSCGVV